MLEILGYLFFSNFFWMEKNVLPLSHNKTGISFIFYQGISKKQAPYLVPCQFYVFHLSSFALELVIANMNSKLANLVICGK